AVTPIAEPQQLAQRMRWRRMAEAGGAPEAQESHVSFLVLPSSNTSDPTSAAFAARIVAAAASPNSLLRAQSLTGHIVGGLVHREVLNATQCEDGLVRADCAAPAPWPPLPPSSCSSTGGSYNNTNSSSSTGGGGALHAESSSDA